MTGKAARVDVSVNLHGDCTAYNVTHGDDIGYNTESHDEDVMGDIKIPAGVYDVFLAKDVKHGTEYDAWNDKISVLDASLPALLVGRFVVIPKKKKGILRIKPKAEALGTISKMAPIRITLVKRNWYKVDRDRYYEIVTRSIDFQLLAVDDCVRFVDTKSSANKFVLDEDYDDEDKTFACKGGGEKVAGLVPAAKVPIVSSFIQQQQLNTQPASSSTKSRSASASEWVTVSGSIPRSLRSGSNTGVRGVPLGVLDEIVIGPDGKVVGGKHASTSTIQRRQSYSGQSA